MPLSIVREIVQIFRALLTVPVVIGEHAYGALSLYYHDARDLEQEEISLVQTMADQAALAIEAARLREQAKTSAAAEERNRLARELHDSVTQNLYSVTLYAEAAARLLASGATVQAAEHLRELRDTSQEALREMRLLIFELRPMDLQKMGLAGAINARLQAVETRGGLQAELAQEGVEYAPLMSHSLQEEIYHITQETLNNTLKHAQAKRVSVALHYGPQLVRLQVRDDGRGFSLQEAADGGGLGLRGMRERAQRIRGCLTIDSAPGQGTTVTVEAPVDGAGFSRKE
jgi:signal transduction histidine kinase